MAVKIILFGRLTDIAGISVSLENIADTNSLVEALNILYPALGEAKYAIAVDKRVVNENTALTENSVVALLPPFSGG